MGIKFWRNSESGRVIERESHIKMLFPLWVDITEKVNKSNLEKEDTIKPAEDSDDLSETIETIEDIVKASELGIENITQEDLEFEIEMQPVVETLEELADDEIDELVFNSYTELNQTADKSKPAFVENKEYRHDGSRWRRING